MCGIVLVCYATTLIFEEVKVMEKVRVGGSQGEHGRDKRIV